MKFQNFKTKAKTALAATTVAVLSAPAMADGGIIDTVKTEITGLKAEVIALGVIVVGIAVAFALMRVGKRGANSI